MSTSGDRGSSGSCRLSSRLAKRMNGTVRGVISCFGSRRALRRNSGWNSVSGTRPVLGIPPVLGISATADRAAAPVDNFAEIVLRSPRERGTLAK